jgi:hypothetical protein
VGVVFSEGGGYALLWTTPGADFHVGCRLGNEMGGMKSMAEDDPE